MPISAYQRTNKNNFEPQIVKVGNIQAAHEDIVARVAALNLTTSTSKSGKKMRSDEHDGLVGDGSEHHLIAADEGNPLHVKTFLAERADDPAFNVCFPSKALSHY